MLFVSLFRLFALSDVTAHIPGGHSGVFKCKLVKGASATRPRAFLHTHGDVRFYGERESYGPSDAWS